MTKENNLGKITMNSSRQIKIIGYLFAALSSFSLIAEEIHTHAQAGNLEKIKELLSKGADQQIDIDRRDHCGMTPMHLAALSNHYDVAQFLLASGADPHAQDHAKATPMHLAAWSGSEKIVAALIKAGASLIAQNDNGCTPLHWAIWSNQKRIVKFILDRFPSALEVANKDGSTPLHTAALNGRYTITTFLLDHGADKHAQTTQQLQIRGTTIRAGLTPYDIARCRQHTRVANLLVAAPTR